MPRLIALQSRPVTDKTQHIYILNTQRPHAGVLTQHVTHPEHTTKHTSNECKYFTSLVYKRHRPNKRSAHMAIQSDLNEMQYMTLLI